MKSQLIAIVAAVLLVGCGPSVDIHQAAEEGNIEAVKQAIADGADVNAMDVLLGWTPLDYAEGETADLLRKHGGKTSLWLRAGESIHIAAAAGHIEAVKQYLADGVDVNAKNDIGGTPLSDAVLWGLIANATAGSSNGHKEVAELLIAKGANVNTRNDRGWTPLDFALNVKNGGAIADFLRKHGAKTERELNDVLIEAGKKGDIEAVKQHLAAGTDVNGEGRRGSTVLHNAAAAGHKEITQLLIAKGADVNAKNPSGRTPLDFVSKIKINNRDEIVDLLRKHGGKTREELKVGESRKAPAQPPSPPVEPIPVEPVAKAAPPEPPTAKAPATSIHDAAMDGDVEAVKQHLADGADVNAKTEGGVFSGRTPLDLAWLTRQTKTADFLRKHGGKTGKELKAEGK